MKLKMFNLLRESAMLTGVTDSLKKNQFNVNCSLAHAYTGLDWLGGYVRKRNIIPKKVRSSNSLATW